MNRALLDGIVAGTVTLDVQEGGALVFLHKSALAEATSGDSAAEEAISPS
jgi:hypothetical protein